MAMQQMPRLCKSLHSRNTVSREAKVSPSSIVVSPCSSQPLIQFPSFGRSSHLAQFPHIAFSRPSRLQENTQFVVRSSSNSSSSLGKWLPRLPASDVSISDVLWPSAGAFVAMALLGRLDQMIARKGLSLTIAPVGAVSVVLFATPNSPAAKKSNMFVAQVACGALGVLAFSLFGPGWLARGAALAASIAFMITTGATHPPAASLPILFIDGAKFHKLHLWYAFFPGAVGCLLLCLIQEIVMYLKNNYKF